MDVCRVIQMGSVDERGRLLEALQRAGGNRSLAARHLGIGRATLYRWITRHGIDADAASASPTIPHQVL